MLNPFVFVFYMHVRKQSLLKIMFYSLNITLIVLVGELVVTALKVTVSPTTPILLKLNYIAQSLPKVFSYIIVFYSQLELIGYMKCHFQVMKCKFRLFSNDSGIMILNIEWYLHITR